MLIAFHGNNGCMKKCYIYTYTASFVPNIMPLWQRSVDGGLHAWPVEMRCFHLEINSYPVAIDM
jgi:hypothetical protein